MMLLRIAAHEFRYMFWSLQTLFIACLLFGLAFLFTANGVEFQSTARGGNVFINSPYIITTFLVFLSLLAVFFVPSFTANTVLKDFDSKFDAILFSTPITKNGYLLGRFLGAYLALMAGLSAAPIGMFLGTFWPWAVPDTLGTIDIWHYLIVYFSFVIPTIFSLAAVIFAVAVMSRSMMYSYLAALGMLLLYVAVAGSETISAIWDPFTAEALAEQTRYWTAAERNSELPSYTGMIVTNRLIWLGVALSLFAAAYFRFSPRSTAHVAKKSPNIERAEGETEAKAAVDVNYRGTPTWTKGTHFQQLGYQTKFEALALLKSKPFIVLMGSCLFLLYFTLTGRETLYDVNTYPLTRLLLEAIRGALTFALMAVLAFYSADVIWRERTHKFNEIIDAMPAPNWVFVVSKIAALTLVMHAIVLLGIVIAILLQAISGFHEFQIGLYIERGLFFYPLPYIFLAVLTCFFQVLVKNRVVGILLFVLFMALLVLSRDIFGFEHILISYGLPGIPAPLSDMNSDSRLATAGYWARAYWGSIAALLLMLTYMLWNRGTLQPLKYRLRNLRAFRSKAFAVPALVLLAVFFGTGSYIFYNTNVLNKYRTLSDIEQIQLAYEDQYRQFENLPMPRTIDVKIDVDIYPYRRRVEARSTQILQNKTDQEIRTVHVIFPIETEVRLAELEGSVRQSVDADLGYYIFDLEIPMVPGEKRTLEFETVIQQQGFPNARPDIKLVRNGTFIADNHLAPHIGVHKGLMISDRNTRRKYGLDPLPRMPKLEDINGRNNNYLRQDSDFINFETTVSTTASQTAIAPGYLVEEWIDGDRRYFKYKMDAPIMNFYSFLSADYEIARDKWNDVDIEIFHHGPHTYNVDRMIAGVKDSLSYFSKAFGPYQYRQARILEFPAYRTKAQAFPNTIPFSEGIGFVADVRDPQEIDLPYYVTAHEMAHQWWAHQVMAAHVQGGTMLVETLAQYGALMVMEQRYGEHQVHKFLKLELDRYLSGRAGDPEGELPLYKVENQSYIHYRKGAVIMYALKDYIGEDVINRALRRLIEEHAYESAPYAVSTDLIGYLKEEAGAEHHNLIEDFFEKITLYDLKVVDSTVTERSDGRFKVSIDVKVAKSYEDGLGNQTEVAFDIPVDIGLFMANPTADDFSASDVVMLEKHRITRADSTLQFIADRKPTIVGIDPYNKLIDRDSNDNLRIVNDTD